MDKYNYIIDRYNISIDIDTINLKYIGNVLIDLEIKKKINSIKINSSELKIGSIKINCDKIDNWEENKVDECIQINYNFIKDKKYQIYIKFENSIHEDMDGFYYCKQNNDLIFCTHFEPKSARKFIPCFDEPDLKAIFILSVSIESEYNVLSNNSVSKVTGIENGLRTKYFFKPTPKMSTYLLCIVAGNIVKANNKPLITNDLIQINGYTTNIDKNKILWSIAHTKKALEFFTNWFGIKYPLEKLDIVSIPNFSSGAMENWGLITFRDEYILLYDNENYLSKIKILEVIYHEIAHQWFGNLVTMDNWESLWLNESTATYFSWMALEEQYPEYMVMELYWLLECKNVMITDAMTNTHPIVMTNNNSDETNSSESIDPMDMFDEITYSKGNIVIKYIGNMLGIDKFQKSINKYLTSNLYSNAKSNQLYSFFNEYSTNKQIDWMELMNNLTSTKGYPILYIEKDSSSNKYYIRFKKFNLDKSLESEYPYPIWLKIKYLDPDNILVNTMIKLEPEIKNLIPNYITMGKFFINPDNILFAICKYEQVIPELEIMNQVELMKYLHEEFILCEYSYTNLSYYLNLILFVFAIVDLNLNYLLLYQVILDLIKIIHIYSFSDKDNKKIIEFIKNNLRKKWINVLEILIRTKTKYYQMVVDKIFELEIYLNSPQVKDLVFKYYSGIINTTEYNINCYFERTLFVGIIKYFQNEQINQILDLLKKTSNPNISSNIIESFSMLNNKNFDLIFNDYKNLIKSQDYSLFFWSISRITSKQEFVIDYWINNYAEISNIPEIQFKILKKISFNIYKSNLIDKIIGKINTIYSSKYRLIFGKIIDILQTNKIVSDNFKY